MNAIASGSSSCGMYFGFEVDGFDGAVEWDDDRRLAESRADWFAEEVEEARGFRCATERGFARLDTGGSEAGGAKDEDELPPDSGRR